MTQSAPMDRTMSKFVVLHTPVTFAANDFALCTANVPTPPAEPLIKTFCPCRIRPLSRKPCSAVSAATCADAAWSNDTLADLRTYTDLICGTNCALQYTSKS